MSFRFSIVTVMFIPIFGSNVIVLLQASSGYTNEIPTEVKPNDLPESNNRI
jgi:hypothetical protein